MSDTTVQLELDIKEDVEDEASNDASVAPVQYEISSFGADYDVEGLVLRMKRGDIFVPPFQREYVWTIKEASRFIESLLLGLPVPGIFLARDSGKTNKSLIIDGQQRLKTLRFFYEGVFNPQEDSNTNRVFKLIEVQKKFENCTYETLHEDDRIKLRDSIIHATIVKQESPDNDNTSIYHIFERLNNGGRKLVPQQIRVAIYHGLFMEMIREINAYAPWREIYGKRSPYLKDEELVLRFLALYFEASNYFRPMNEFLNKFMEQHKNPDDDFLNTCRQVFKSAIDLIAESVQNRAFRPERALNAAVFDSVMVGLAKRLDNNANPSPEKFKIAYEKLLQNEDYKKLFIQSTADESNLSKRIDLATKHFQEV